MHPSVVIRMNPDNNSILMYVS